MMKQILICGLVILVLACNNAGNSQAGGDTSVTAETTPTVTNRSYCFMKASNRDTVRLEYTLSGDSVNGYLSYNFYGKDKSKGTISGKLLGDTLLAMYHFLSEGLHSRRQVIFLQKGNQMLEGFGEMREVSGEMIFTDRSRNEFGNFNVLTACESYTSSIVGGKGSESLYQFRWVLVELEGKKVDTALLRGAFLAFEPGTVGKVTGNTGCNNMSGNFELSGNDSITFARMIMTRKACLGANIESAFTHALGRTATWKIKGNELHFYGNDTLYASFKASAVQ